MLATVARQALASYGSSDHGPDRQASDDCRRRQGRVGGGFAALGPCEDACCAVGDYRRAARVAAARAAPRRPAGRCRAVRGAAGSFLFAVLGFLASIPMLVRLHRRFETWRAPAIALAVFGAVFALSTFVIGPAITGGSGDSSGKNAAPSDSGHESHHR